MLFAHILNLLAPGDEIAQMKQLRAQFVGPRVNAGWMEITEITFSWKGSPNSQIVVDVLGWLQVDARGQTDQNGEQAQAEAPAGEESGQKPGHDCPGCPDTRDLLTADDDGGGGRSSGSAT